MPLVVDTCDFAGLSTWEKIPISAYVRTSAPFLPWYAKRVSKCGKHGALACMAEEAARVYMMWRAGSSSSSNSAEGAASRPIRVLPCMKLGSNADKPFVWHTCSQHHCATHTF